MKKIKWTWKKITALVAGFLGIGTLVSCYGMPIIVKNYVGTVTGDIDGDGTEEPVPGICVSSYLDYNVFTDSKGQFTIESNPYNSITFEDKDGDLNGSFKTKVVTPAEGIYELNVHLERKE